jgi:universal stress protein E
MMAGLSRVLAATDLSPRAELAVERAAMLAQREAAELHLLHVIGRLPLEAMKRIFSEHPLETEQRLLDDAATELGQLAARLGDAHGIRVASRVQVGSPPAEINAYAEKHACDLVVMGAHGENFVLDIMLGTTAQKVVRAGRGPFLLVKDGAGKDYSRVLVAVDFSPTSRCALQAAMHLAGSADIGVLHVYQVPFESKMRYSGVSEDAFRHYQELAAREARADMEFFLRDLDEASARRVTRMVRYGYAPSVIMRQAGEHGADLVVVGAQGRSELSHMLLGSVALHVMHEFSGDVLVVKSAT